MALVIIINNASPRLWGMNMRSPVSGSFVKEIAIPKKVSFRAPVFDARDAKPKEEIEGLFSSNPRHEHIQKPIRIHLDADFGIGLDLVDAFDHVAIAMQHVAFDIT